MRLTELQNHRAQPEGWLSFAEEAALPGRRKEAQRVATAVAHDWMARPGRPEAELKDRQLPALGMKVAAEAMFGQLRTWAVAQGHTLPWQRASQGREAALLILCELAQSVQALRQEFRDRHGQIGLAFEEAETALVRTVLRAHLSGTVGAAVLPTQERAALRAVVARAADQTPWSDQRFSLGMGAHFREAETLSLALTALRDAL